MTVANILGRSLIIAAAVSLLTGAGIFGNKARKGEGGADVSEVSKCA